MDIEHAPKFKALMQLLNDCGIGNTDKVVSEHRALIFCQHKSIIGKFNAGFCDANLALDLIETELFKSKMPSVSYMRLDGSVPAGSRHSIVSKFNHDPSIDVLLLTTKGKKAVLHSILTATSRWPRTESYRCRCGNIYGT